MRLIHIIAIVIASISMLVNCMTANATNSVKARLQNRYILAGYVNETEMFHNGVKTVYVLDENGEEWLYSYASIEKIPSDGQKVTMVMNSNGTETIYDDIIEDVLWARPDEVNVD